MSRTSQATVPAPIPMARPWFGEEEALAVQDVVRSGWVAQGAQVAAFERAVADAVGARHTVAVSSCTTALHLGMVVSGVGPGDEVVVPSLSFVATANAVRYVGAVPVFADVDPATHNVTADTVAAAITARTRAVVVVHQYGVPADLHPLRRLCRDREVTMIEDAACAIGSTHRGVPVGADSEFAAFSFHPRKVLVTGEGGMIATSDPWLARRLDRLRQHAMSVSTFDRHRADDVVVESYLETGFNFRMTDMQGALGVVQCSKLPAMVARRRELGARYRALLAGIPGLEMVADPEDGLTNYQSFWIVLPEGFPVERDVLLKMLLDAGIHARHGVTAAHLEPAFADLDPVMLPVTERVARRSVLLPIHHWLTPADQERVAEVVVDAASRP